MYTGKLVFCMNDEKEEEVNNRGNGEFLSDLNLVTSVKENG